MAETKKVTLILPNTVLDEANALVPMEYKNMSDFVAEAIKFFIKEKKKVEAIESLKKGYREMSKVNLKLAEIGLKEDIMDLAIYEESLKRCEML